MWHERCQHCEQAQFFGLRRVIRLENPSKGVIEIDWVCRNCDGVNQLRTGKALAAA